MWVWLAALPTIWQLVIVILTIFAIVVISLFGKFVWNAGVVKIGIGKDKNNKKRSCVDCIRIILGKTAKFQVKRDILQSNILKNQMTFAEIKLKEFELFLIQDYKSQLVKKRTESTNLQDEHKQFLIYQEALMNSFDLIKSEIRRSFKENGFHQLSGNDYASYVKAKAESLVSIGRQYLLSRYPFEGMTISLEERFASLDKSRACDHVFDIYNRAKEIRKEADNDISELDSRYEKEINDFIGE